MKCAPAPCTLVQIIHGHTPATAAPPHLRCRLGVSQLRQQALRRGLLLVSSQHGDDASDGVTPPAQVGADGGADSAQDGAAGVAVGQGLDGAHILLDDVGGGGTCMGWMDGWWGRREVWVDDVGGGERGARRVGGGGRCG